MQKINQSLKQSQKLTRQQIQFIQLLQIPATELESRIKEEVESNPVLEETDEHPSNETTDEADTTNEENTETLDEYYHEEEYEGYKMTGDKSGLITESPIPIKQETDLNTRLIEQLRFLELTPLEFTIGEQLIGSIDERGYISRDLYSIVDDLEFNQNIVTTEKKIEEILLQIHTFDPPGIGARHLHECLQIQIDRKLESHPDSKRIGLAQLIIKDYFEFLKKKHYNKIIEKINVNEEEVKKAIEEISKLNPKPGESDQGFGTAQYLQPDFILEEKDNDFFISLNSLNAPELRLSKTYTNIFNATKKESNNGKTIIKDKETFRFLKQKMEDAHWFINAIKQRQETLLMIMNAIYHYQKAFFKSGEDNQIKPMILQDIADRVGVDISTISRVVNSKSIQTKYGLYLLKHFFSEKIETIDGNEVSNKQVKNNLQEIIEKEDKKKPLSDEKLKMLLQKKGYKIQRRTVAKYREKLGIPVARLRKEL